VGPGADLPGRIAAFAPLASDAGGPLLRLDFGASALGRQMASARKLTVVVLALDAGVLALLLLFLRHLLSPFERLLDRARQVRAERGADDEVEFLLSTFEQALQALARERQAGAEDDIRVLERTLTGSLESGLLLLDKSGGVLAVNPRGAELLGVAPPAPGTGLAEALAAHPALAGRLASAVAGGEAVQRAEVETAGRTLGLSVHPLRRDDGSVRGHLVLFADLTLARRREGEARLAEGLAQLGELAAGVAHELRNSVATLEGYLSLIERRPDEGSLADFLGEIRRELAHLRRVVEDFLAFARPGTARLEMVDLPALLARAAADPALAGARIALGASPPGATLRGDPQLLERALKNLLHNAVEAERERGLPGGAEVELRRDGDRLEISIEDRGPGLPPEVRRRLFQPFVSARSGGVGLGLALAHRIVTLHGGTLRLDERPAGGTRASITFASPVSSE
jgi:signal transduction histidine kinase